MVVATTPKARVFRLPTLTYIVVVFLFVGAVPLAFTSDGTESSAGHIGPQSLLMLLPIIAAVFVWRTATIVTGRGIVVRAAFGRRALPWGVVRGLSVSGSSVYAVLADGSVRLPCVRVTNLAELARASDGRLPKIADPTPKSPPTRQRRQR